MSRRKTTAWKVSPHAKQRAWERYGIIFSPQKWLDFCNTMQKKKFTIRLGNDSAGSCRFACYFQQRWFLVGCNTHGRIGIVTTFLPADTLVDSEKMMLVSAEQYRQIDDDHQETDIQMPLASKRKISLAKTRIFPEELPDDFDQIDRLLKNVGIQMGR